MLRRNTVKFRFTDVRRELRDLGFQMTDYTFKKIYKKHFTKRIANIRFSFTRKEVEDLKRFFWVYKMGNAEYPKEKFIT